MSRTAASPAFILFGATGDLALRMLLPSLYFLEEERRLPERLRILAAARSELSTEAYLASARAACSGRAAAFCEASWARLASRITYFAGDVHRDDLYETLRAASAECDAIVIYLSTSPQLFAPIVAGLATAGLAGPGRRIVVEKPLGRDLATCRAINDVLAAAFAEDDIFRVDHYLGKETVQNLLALRFGNLLFEPLWNKTCVEHVQITVAETLGVEGRAEYYDAAGALRDMVQNHLLQLLCLVAMEPPAQGDADAVRDEKVKVLRALRPICANDVARLTARGQYGPGVAEGAAVRGYLDEGGDEATETYVALCVHVDNWRWAGVPFYLRTGKRLPRRTSEIVVRFRPVPHSIFPDNALQPNTLTIRLQPEERISLSVMNRTAELATAQLEPLTLDLSLTDAYRGGRGRRRIAYERLLLEALRGDATLFVRRDEGEVAWAWVDSVRGAWRKARLEPSPYPAGAWGPSGAHALTERNGHSWAD